MNYTKIATVIFEMLIRKGIKYGAKPSRPAKIVPPFTMALLT